MSAGEEIGTITLLEKDGKMAQQKKSVFNRDRVVFGSGTNAVVRLKTKGSSIVFPEHCVITCENGDLYLEKKFNIYFLFLDFVKLLILLHFFFF